MATHLLSISIAVVTLTMRLTVCAQDTQLVRANDSRAELAQVFEQGSKYYEGGQWEQAIRCLHTYASQTTSSDLRDKSLFMLAESYSQLDRLEEALKILDRFVDRWGSLAAHAPPACYRRAELLYRLGRDPQAIQQLLDFLKNFSYDLRYSGYSYCLLTGIAHENDRPADASLWYSDALNVAADACRKKEFVIARTIYEQLISSRQDKATEVWNYWAATWCQEAHQWMTSAEYEKACTNFKALLAEPRFMESGWGAVAYQGIADAYFAQGRYDDALQAYMAVDCMYGQWPDRQVHCLRKAAECYTRLKLPELAQSLHERADRKERASQAKRPLPPTAQDKPAV